MTSSGVLTQPLASESGSGQPAGPVGPHSSEVHVMRLIALEAVFTEMTE